MKIGKKISSGYLLVVAMMLVIAVISGVFLGINSANSSQAYRNYGVQQGNVGGLGYYYQRERVAVRDILLRAGSNDMKGVAESEKILEELKTNISDYEAQIKEGLQDDGEAHSLFQTILADISEDEEIRTEIIALAKNGQSMQAYQKLINESGPVAQEVTTKILDLFTLMRENGTRAFSNATLLAIIGVIIDASMLAIGIGTALVVGIRVKNSIVRPVAKVEKAIIQLSEGDLKQRVDYNGKDEIGVLARAYNDSVETLSSYIKAIETGMAAMAKGDFSVSSTVAFKGDFKNIEISIGAFLDSINEAFASIHQVSDQVSSGSDQVSSGAQALSQGATEQASAVQELDATITEISHRVKENAENATFANNEANDLGNGIIENNQQMQEMIRAMDEISNSSDEISKIIKTIQDIAFQTNILALNAAVEAARAGAAGKGFAVVADEVRNLASKSSEAAKDTTALIENSIRAVQNGTKIADDTAHSLEQIVIKAREVAEVINKISQASNDQATSVAQVTQGIDQISSVVQTNSATAEQSAAASEELSSQAQLLDQMIRKYKLREGAVDSSGNRYYDSGDSAAPYYEDDYRYDDVPPSHDKY